VLAIAPDIGSPCASSCLRLMQAQQAFLTGTSMQLLQVEAFFDVHEEMGTVPGGLHLEMTGDNVTECIGGGSGVTGTRCCDPAASAVPGRMRLTACASSHVIQAETEFAEPATLKHSCV
jgi:Class-II DAHP synthetase family